MTGHSATIFTLSQGQQWVRDYIFKNISELEKRIKQTKIDFECLRESLKIYRAHGERHPTTFGLGTPLATLHQQLSEYEKDYQEWLKTKTWFESTMQREAITITSLDPAPGKDFTVKSLLEIIPGETIQYRQATGPQFILPLGSLSGSEGSPDQPTVIIREE